jgi:hypothetical protein
MQFQEIFRISDPIGPFSCKLDRTTADNFIDLENELFFYLTTSDCGHLKNFAKTFPFAFTNNIYFDLHPIEQELRETERRSR